ncbi:peptide deformylase [Anaerocolumna jejuensis DSM 15929]|uniref:Peptide deformylase n=1 Tax=Anaerocolumna jejuensis DSM 15929 TaxID=1121322 RepID=A0A1M6PSJ1_9FIRM|nr:peptide deformylase [Anaerocolumna jejuensis DSM 15929]
MLVALREIRTFEDEILRKKSKAVAKVDDKIRQLLEDMAETMYHTPNGGGLAACQVGILRRLVVADMGEGLLKLVNPEITEQEGEQTVIEGCLSYPGVWGKLIRPYRVVVRALNEKGEQITIEAVGDLAKCLCHEIDHLEGIIFTDKVIEYVKAE